MSKCQRFVYWEWLQATWTWELGNQCVGVDIDFCALYSRSEIEIELAIESFFDELVVPRNKTERRILLREVIPFPVFRISGLPLGSLSISWKIFFGGIIGLGVSG